MEIVFGVTIAASVAAMVFVVFYERRAWIARRMGRRAIVHLSDERSIEGTLMVSARDGIVLAGATYLEGAGTNLGGEIYVPRERLLFVQLP